MKSTEEIDEFEKAINQLNMLIKDFSELSKKKPSESVNTFKLDIVNGVLEKLNNIVDDSDKPFKSFSQFSVEEIPSTSDVLVILNQYHTCSKRFARKNIEAFDYSTYWVVGNERTRRVVSIDRLFGD